MINKDEVSSRSEAVPESAKRQRFSRLLIIEDDQSQLRTLTDLAKGEGLDVTGCSTATEALDHFQREEFGVVIRMALPCLVAHRRVVMDSARLSAVSNADRASGGNGVVVV